MESCPVLASNAWGWPITRTYEQTSSPAARSSGMGIARVLVQEPALIIAYVIGLITYMCLTVSVILETNATRLRKHLIVNRGV